jgi:hypothetical protein
VVKVLSSPRKTLKEVIQEPKYIGPLLVLILFMAVSIGSTYVIISKEQFEQTLPTTTDQWTQNRNFWNSTSNTTITESNDSIAGTIYSNISIAFSTQDSPQVLMDLNNIGKINCTRPNGYDLLSFRIKWTRPSVNPQNVTIQMFSDNSSSDYYYKSLTDTFLNATNDIWNNVTVQLAFTDWNNTGNPYWGNITGLQLQFTWAGSSNVTLLIDGLFFHGPFKSLLDTEGSSYLLSDAVTSAFQFVITWVIFAGLIFLLARVSGGKPVWKPLFIAIGFILITMFIAGLITAIGYATLPVLRYPFELIGGVKGEGTAAANTIANQTSLFTQVNLVAQIVIWLWTIALAAVALRLVVGFSWAKSVAFALLAYVIIIFLEILGIIPVA